MTRNFQEFGFEQPPPRKKIQYIGQEHPRPPQILYMDSPLTCWSYKLTRKFQDLGQATSQNFAYYLTSRRHFAKQGEQKTYPKKVEVLKVYSS